MPRHHRCHSSLRAGWVSESVSSRMSLCYPYPRKDLGPYVPHVTQVKTISEVVAVMWRSILFTSRLP